MSDPEKMTDDRHQVADYGVSIITCTHVPYYMDNIFNNYDRQSHTKKELILILNNRMLNMTEWLKKANNYQNVRIYKIHEKISVGTCMNFAVDRARYGYIANFDHDDYYGSKYLNDYLEVVPTVDAGLFGKKSHYVYMEEDSTLSIQHPDFENCYVDYVDGPTEFFKKTVSDTVRFVDDNFADCAFSWSCSSNGIKIYSVNRYHFAYIRKKDINLHTWKMENSEIISNYCTVIGKMDDYETYADNDKL